MAQRLPEKNCLLSTRKRLPVVVIIFISLYTVLFLCISPSRDRPLLVLSSTSAHQSNSSTPAEHEVTARLAAREDNITVFSAIIDHVAIDAIEDNINITVLSAIIDHVAIDASKCGQLYMQRLYTSLFQRNDVKVVINERDLPFVFGNDIFLAGVGEQIWGNMNSANKQPQPCSHVRKNTRAMYDDILPQFETVLYHHEHTSQHVTAPPILYFFVHNSPIDAQYDDVFPLTDAYGRISQKTFLYLNNEKQVFRVLYDVSFPPATLTLFDATHATMWQTYLAVGSNMSLSSYTYNISFQGSPRSYFANVLLPENHTFYHKIHPNLRQYLFQYFCDPTYVDEYGIAFSLWGDGKNRDFRYPIANRPGTQNCSQKQSTFDYVQLTTRSHFCFVISGHSPWSFRLMEVLAGGCIPIIVNSGWVLPFNQIIDWKRYAIGIEEEYFVHQYEDVESFLQKYFYSDTSIAQKLLNTYYGGDLVNWHRAILVLYQRYFSSPAKRIDGLIQTIRWQRRHVHNKTKITFDATTMDIIIS